jgi:PAS domain S-box-containing protein
MLVWYVFIPPQFSFELQSASAAASIALFILMGVLFSWFFDRLKQSMEKTSKALEEVSAANAKITELYQKTLELDELKTQFFSNVSHEFRTPLTLLMAPLEQRLSHPASRDSSPETRGEAEMMLRNAHLLYHHVTDLLDAAKLQAGGMKIIYSRHDLAYQVRSVAAHFESVALTHAIHFEVTTPPCVVVEADAEQVQRILMNLLSNAFKFTPDGGAITLRLSALGDNAKLEVQDNGPGIPVALREAVFERFRQVDGGSNRRRGGTGLGLAIVRDFTAMHAGTAVVNDALGGGALFTVTIPLHAPMGTDVLEAAPVQSDTLRNYPMAELLTMPASTILSKEGQQGKDRPLILVVEDNSDMNQYLLDVLGVKFRVASASNGREGLEKARSLVPDLILGDVMMPVMSGDAMVGELRQIDSLKSTPIVLLTAKSDDLLRIKMLSLGVQDFVSKPFNVEELLARIQRLLDDRKSVLNKYRESDDLFRAAFDSVAVGIAVLTVQGSWVRVNGRLAEILGYTEVELLTKSFQDLSHPVDLDADLILIQELLGGEIPSYTLEKRYIRKDGVAIWANLTVSLVRTEKGTPALLVNAIEDISQRKQATDGLREALEEQQRMRLASLALMEDAQLAQKRAEEAAEQIRSLSVEAKKGYELFNRIAALAPVGIYRTDLRGSCEYVNGKWCEMTGLSLEAAFGDGWLRALHPADKSFVFEQWELFVSGQHTFDGQYRFLRPDGVEVNVADTAVTISDANGTATGYLGTVTDITKLRQTEKHLQEVKDRLETAASAGIVGVWDWDVPNNRLIWDAVMYQLYGLRQGDWGQAYEAWARTINPEDRAYTEGEIQAALRGEREYAPEFRVVWPDGSIHHIQAKSKTTFDAQGKPLRMVGINYDVTEQKKIEHDLRAESEKNQTLLRNASDGICIMNREGRIEEVGDSFCKMLGYTREEMIGMHVTQWDANIPAADLDEVVRDAFENRIRIEFESSHRTKNGVIVPVEVSAIPFEFLDSQLLFCTTRDITERKRQEKDLQEKTAQLAAILSNVGVGISHVVERRQFWGNQVLADMFGYRREEMNGLSVREFYADNESFDSIGLDAYCVLSEGSKFSRELEMRHRDGHCFWVCLTGNAIDPSNLRNGTIWVIENIEERKRIEHELVAARESADAANLSKSRFLATMSHEIRTPMNGILGMAQLLLATELSERSRSDYARTILGSGQTLLMLLNDILDLSKIEAGQLQLEQIAFDPATLLHETVSLFSGAAQTKSLQLDCKWCGPELCRYAADAYRIRQMLNNLVGNAIKFTAQGYIHIEGTELELGPDGVVLEFSVTDTGIGIPQDKIELLFKPFSQTDDSTTREFGGSGLGLSIVSNLAKAMGGSVGVESAQGKGSKFWFRLRPRQVESGEESRSAERTAHQDALAPNSNIKADGRVLVVEDNPVNCMVIELLLATMGVKVTIVNDGQQAVDTIRSGDRPNVILMDLHMPVMDGYTATQLIRQWESEQDTVRLPIIALTADAFAEDKKHCMDVGMDDFLTKPVEIEALKAAMAIWMPAQSSLPFGKPTAPQKHNPLDLPHFEQLIAELGPLLQANLFDAFDRFKDLQALVEGTAIAVEIDEMAPEMELLRFDLVLQHLNSLSDRLSRSPL